MNKQRRYYQVMSKGRRRKMAKAYQCDECGEFFPGGATSELTVEVNGFLVKMNVRKSKPKKAESEDVDTTKYSAMSYWFPITLGGSSSDEAVEICSRCLDALATAALRKMSDERVFA